MTTLIGLWYFRVVSDFIRHSWTFLETRRYSLILSDVGLSIGQMIRMFWDTLIPSKSRAYSRFRESPRYGHSRRLVDLNWFVRIILNNLKHSQILDGLRWSVLVSPGWFRPSLSALQHPNLWLAGVGLAGIVSYIRYRAPLKCSICVMLCFA